MSDTPFDPSNPVNYPNPGYTHPVSANPAAPPPLPNSPVYSASLATAASGPILLIALGTLFAIDYMGGVRFSRTWPALLILFGIFKLVEHLRPASSATAASRPDGMQI